MLNVIASYEYQKNECVQQWNLFKCQHQTFIFQHIVQIYFIWTRRSDRMRRDCCDRWISRWNNTSARSFFINKTFSSTSKLLTPNMYCWSCHLSPYTGRISEWMVFGQRLFALRKWITERCSLRNAFSGSVAIFIVDKWRHSDVIVIKLTAVIQNYVQNLYFGFFYILKINRIMKFCNLFMGRPSYYLVNLSKTWKQQVGGIVTINIHNAHVHSSRKQKQMALYTVNHEKVALYFWL